MSNNGQFGGFGGFGDYEGVGLGFEFWVNVEFSLSEF